jgi:molybdopterin-biosynthesis enzyme MoeA-like protein
MDYIIKDLILIISLNNKDILYKIEYLIKIGENVIIDKPSFYSVIIGTELLNGRRVDSHFEFLNRELVKRGWEQKASFVIKDDPTFMAEVFSFVASDPNGVMFSFGGIGSTPDDYTRAIASKVFRGEDLVTHQEAARIIIDKFGDDAYPHRIEMANLPPRAGLLKNVVTKVPGFYIDERYFFVPGFPSMAKDMVVEALDKFYPQSPKKYSYNFLVLASENELIDIMKELPNDLDISCLPQIDGNKRRAEIYICDEDREKLDKWYKFFQDQMKTLGLEYKTISNGKLDQD